MFRNRETYKNLKELKNEQINDVDYLKFSYCKFPTFTLPTTVTSLMFKQCEIETIICPSELTDLFIRGSKISKIICNEKLLHLTIDHWVKTPADPIIENLPDTLLSLNVQNLINKIPTSLTYLTCDNESLIQLVITNQLEKYPALHAVNGFSPWNQPSFKNHVFGLMSECIPWEKLKDLYVECKYGVGSERYKQSEEKISSLQKN